jgi:hypothetical protein
MHEDSHHTVIAQSSKCKHPRDHPLINPLHCYQETSIGPGASEASKEIRPLESFPDLPHRLVLNSRILA